MKPQRRTPGDHQENPLPTRAACQDEDPELFFPAGYSETYAREIEKAVGVCGRCPLSAACLRYALDQGEIEHGIYGGTTPEQRRQLLSRRAAA
ncbi:WhiB family transcriptional regulator [Actinomadura sp. ATCC 39365]